MLIIYFKLLLSLYAISSFTDIICGAAQTYYGTYIGSLSQLHHGVSGDVYAVDSRNLFLKNFNYDGEGPAAYFYVGNTARPNNIGGQRLRDERGSIEVLRRYRNKDISLSLPEGKTLRDIRWFSVWCDKFSVNFGDVKIPKNLEFPRPHKVAPLKGVHEVSSDNIVIVDAQTILIPNFNYDGDAPDAKFWVGRGHKPTPKGMRIHDENGSENPLQRYDHKTIVLTLPGDLTVFDIDHFGVWCEAFTVDFGHIRIPPDLNVPPSLKMLGISPQSKLNCEVLHNQIGFEVRWAIAGESIVVQLVAKLGNGQYMSFGISPNRRKTVMVGADVVVAWVDQTTGKGYAIDYFLNDKSQCAGSTGSCPDTRLIERSNSIRLLNAAMVNGYSIVTFQRPLRAADKFDLPIFVNGSQAVLWAIGPLNERNEVSFHTDFSAGNHFIEFGRQPLWNCSVQEEKITMSDDIYEDILYGRTPVISPPNHQQYHDHLPKRRPLTQRPDLEHEQQLDLNMHEVSSPSNPTEINRNGYQSYSHRRTNSSAEPLGNSPVPLPKSASRSRAWVIPPIQCYEPEDGVFYAQMGPTGGKQGYPAITGHVGWGISWYINGLLIPEINVVRGKIYTFVVEGGTDPEIPAKYHPFYISDDPIGGYEYKTDEEKSNIKIFAGVTRNRSGADIPVGVGRLCNWTPNIDGPPADEYSSFGAYQRSLTLKCDEGEPGIITWRPDKNTPDTVYYHCFTHRYLGWKINVLDYCDVAEATNIEKVYAKPDHGDDLVPESSFRHEAKLRPNDLFLHQQDKELLKNHNMNEVPPKLYIDTNKGVEISKIIAEGIQEAEALEEAIKRDASDKISVLKQNTGKFSENNLKPENSFPFQNTGISVYLRPPITPMVQKLKLPVRSKSDVFKQISKTSLRRRPIILAQPSMLVSHYKKPISPFIRPFVKESKPITPIASFLLLDQPPEIKPYRKKFETEPSNILTLGRHSDTPSIIKYQTQKTPTSYKNNNPTEIPYNGPYEVYESKSVQPLLNTGFHPDSVIIEGGFRPIIRRTDVNSNQNSDISNRRIDVNVSYENDDMEDDISLSNPDIAIKSFEPMFIPSPLDNTNLTITVPLSPKGSFTDMEKMDVEIGDETLAMAAERIDSYYLPPNNNDNNDGKRTDNLFPEGAVVAYDGKAVLDTSLINLAPPSLSYNMLRDANLTKSGLTNTEQLIRDTPQFKPFTGEIPPSVSGLTHTQSIPPLKIQSNEAESLQSSAIENTRSVSNSSKTISTKLKLLNSTQIN